MGGMLGGWKQVDKHSFISKLEFSMGRSMDNDIERIKAAFYKCARVEKTNTDIDKTGVDYYAVLESGVVINIDAKARERGASRYWANGEPELAIETWSVYKSKPGWTFSLKSDVDYILYSFDSTDADKYYLLPFQLLRNAAIANYRKWESQFPEKSQYSYDDGRKWESRCIFVPASVVLDAITIQMVKSVENTKCGEYEKVV